jgi:preprotein translocase subunit SecG
MFIIVAALLCGVILIQENKSMGLGASFGGDAGSSVFGTSTALIVKKITAWLAIIFFATCIILSLWTQSLGGFQQPNLYPTQADDELVQ